MTEPLFSVIVPTRDRPQLLAEAVRSVLSQTVQDFEVIIVDDGSQKAPQASDDPRVHMVRLPAPRGAAAARNAGLRRASGRYVTFLDDDDIYTADRLALGLETAQRAPIGLCWRASLSSDDGRPHRSLRRIDGNRMFEGNVHDRIMEERVPHLGQATIARRHVLEFDERFFMNEDADWWIRATRDSPVATVPRVGYLLREHDEARLTASSPEARLAIRRLILGLHSEYFAGRPRAAAYRWKLLGGAAQRMGDTREARRAYLRSFRLHPEPRTLLRLVGAMLSKQEGATGREGGGP